jgi:hypothetical protein
MKWQVFHGKFCENRPVIMLRKKKFTLIMVIPKVFVKCVAYRLLVGKPEGKRPLGRPRRRWVDNTCIRMYLGEVGWDVVDWIGLAKDRNRWRALVNSVLNLRVP